MSSQFNILIDGMPDEVLGQPVYTSYRNMILFEQLITNPKVEDLVKINKSLALFYKEPIRQGYEARAFEGLLWFYRGGEPIKRDEYQGLKKRPPRLYDFDSEADLIYASFLDGHGIRLQENTDMHWWEFRALLFTLPSSTPMHDRMMYRSITDFTGYSKDEKARIRKYQKLYQLESYEVPILTSQQKDQLYLDKMNKRYAEARKEMERCRIEKLCDR